MLKINHSFGTYMCCKDIGPEIERDALAGESDLPGGAHTDPLHTTSRLRKHRTVLHLCTAGTDCTAALLLPNRPNKCYYAYYA